MDQAYFERRYRAELACATEAACAASRRVHWELAGRYAALLGRRPVSAGTRVMEFTTP